MSSPPLNPFAESFCMPSLLKGGDASVVASRNSRKASARRHRQKRSQQARHGSATEISAEERQAMMQWVGMLADLEMLEADHMELASMEGAEEAELI